ncbi:MAG TPA: type 1 glutamine amidotransferase [Woeseiaceae bacterium]|nr:type 1 glutamine amidotransferase [Woeseiaceae bacterium]
MADRLGMTATIGILQTGAAPDLLIAEHGDYPDMFEALLRRHRPRLDFRVYRTLADELPGSIDDCDAWLITGSRHSVLEALPSMKRLAAFVRDVAHHDGRLAGIGFGHQIVADALGGRVDRATAGWVVGRRYYELIAGSRAGESVGLNAIHQDEVVSLPEAARVVPPKLAPFRFSHTGPR